MGRAERAGWRAKGLGLGLGLLGTVAAAAGLAGCGGGHGPEASAHAGAAEVRPVAVTVAPLERRTVERVVPVEGTLRPWEEVVVSAKKGGRVLKVRADMGDRVAAGAPLVELDPVDARLAVEQAEARLLGELAKLSITREQAEAFVTKYGIDESIYRGAEAAQIISELPPVRQARATAEKAKQELQRQQGVYRRGAGKLQDVQNAEIDVQAAEAAVGTAELTAQATVASALASWVALKTAQQDASELKVTAPAPQTPPEGVPLDQVQYGVSRRMVSEGQRLKDGEAVFHLVLDNPVRLWANVPERHRPAVRVGQPVRLTAQGWPDETFAGTVARINPTVDETSRTFQVEAVVPNVDGRLRPGGFARGEIIVDSAARAVVVPLEAVYRYAGVTKVFLVEGGKTRGFSIATGRQVDAGIEVVSTGDPLPEAGEVVTSGQTVLAKLAEGTPVELRAAPAAPAAPAKAPAGH